MDGGKCSKSFSQKSFNRKKIIFLFFSPSKSVFSRTVDVSVRSTEHKLKSMFCSLNKRKRKSFHCWRLCWKISSSLSISVHVHTRPYAQSLRRETNTKEEFRVRNSNFLVSQPYDVSNGVNLLQEKPIFSPFSLPPFYRTFSFPYKLTSVYVSVKNASRRGFSIASEKLMLEILKINQICTRTRR